MESSKKIREIKIRKKISLEKITEGCFLIFPDGRKEFVKKVDILACRLYTERVETNSNWKIINQVCYSLNSGYGQANILVSGATGDVYDYTKIRIKKNQPAFQKHSAQKYSK